MPDFGPRDIPGINVAVDANPAARDAFGLRGSAEDEALSGAVKLYDFNGDRERDLLFYGEAASYVLLGPVELDDVTDVRDEADFVIDADVGRRPCAWATSAATARPTWSSSARTERAAPTP